MIMGDTGQKIMRDISQNEGYENVTGFLGTLKRGFKRFEIEFSSYVEQKDNMARAFSDGSFDELFKNHSGIEKNSPNSLSAERFRFRMSDSQIKFTGGVYVKKDGCKKEPHPNLSVLKRDTDGESIYLEESLYKKFYDAFYDKEYYKETSGTPITIENESRISAKYYPMPELDLAECGEKIKKRYLKEYPDDNAFNTVNFNLLFGGFYNNRQKTIERLFSGVFECGLKVAFKNQCCYDKISTDNGFLILRNLSHSEENEAFFKIERKIERGVGKIELSNHAFQENDDSINYFSSEKTAPLSEEITEKLIRIFFNYYRFTVNEYENPLNMDIKRLEFVGRELKRFLPSNCDKSGAYDLFLDRIARDRILGIKQDSFFGTDKNSLEETDNHGSRLEEIFEAYDKRENEICENNEEESPDEELLNLFLTVSLNPITVLIGKNGTGKGSLCDRLGKGLKHQKDGLSENRYREISATGLWGDSKDFEDYLLNDFGYSFNMPEVLNYEAKRKKGSSLPYILCIKNAGSVPIEKCLENFLSICKKWYRTSDCQVLGSTSYKIPNTFRILLVMNDDDRETIPEEILRLAAVVHVQNPTDLGDEIENKNILFAKYFMKYFGEIKEALHSEINDAEIFLRNETLRKDYKELCDIIARSVRVNENRLNVHSVRMEHAVSRHWFYLCKNEIAKPYDEWNADGCYPENVLIDESIVKDTKGKKFTNVDAAMDLALSERVMPFVVNVKGNATLANPSEIFEYLIEKGYRRCISLLKEAIEEERVTISDELSEQSNNEYIIKRCEKLYDGLLKNSKYGMDQVFGKKTSLTKKQKTELIDSICRNINYFRDKNTYTKNVTVNIMICLSQGFLTVFSGKPGCGKTSICRILGGILGLSDYSENGENYFEAYDSFEDRRREMISPDRYFEVSTERGWTSKRDFIGYYNPLTEQFDKSNAMLYNSFLVMDSQAKAIAEAEKNGTKKDTLPCFILLDEANLSPMEHYWADFMNLCEAWSPNNSIDLGGGKIFRIPEALHFVATINNDHTTTVLSPRLIDRSSVIDLPERKGSDCEELEEEKPDISPVSWYVLKSVFGYDGDDRAAEREFKEDEDAIGGTDDKTASQVYGEIKEFVKSKFMVSISPRTDIAVAKYYLVASFLFDDADYPVNEELLEKLNTEKENLREMWESDSREELREIIKTAFRTTENYQTSDRSTQALDYAIAQRVLPKITDLNNEDALYDLLELIYKLSELKLYKSAGIVADIADRGCDNGFYNFFR